MPETTAAPTPAPAVPPAPATPSPSPAPSPAPAATEKTGIAKLSEGFDELVTPKAKPAEKTTPEPKPEPAPAKTEPVPAKEEGEDVVWEKAPPKLRNNYFKTKRELESRISKLDQQIKAIESKPRETAADTKLVTEYQERIKALENDLRQSDYSKSSEFKRDYIDRWNSNFASSVKQISELSVTEMVNDEPKERPATEADFKMLMKLPAREQAMRIKQMFGDQAYIVASRINRLEEIQQAGMEAIANANAQSETKSKEKEIATQKERESFENTRRAADGELLTKYPQFFAPMEGDEEVNAALQKGYEFVDSAATQTNLAPDERAAYASIIRARAGAFPRVVLEKNRLAQEVQTLTTELAKYRKTDPGSGAGNGAPAAKTEPSAALGIKGLADAFNALK